MGESARRCASVAVRQRSIGRAFSHDHVAVALDNQVDAAIGREQLLVLQRMSMSTSALKLQVKNPSQQAADNRQAGRRETSRLACVRMLPE